MTFLIFLGAFVAAVVAGEVWLRRNITRKEF